MESLLMLVLGLAVTNGHVGEDAKSAANTAKAEPSFVSEAVDGISVLANKITPIQTQITGDNTAESAPAAVVWVHVSKKYLADYIERSVDHEKPARENVLGIIFTGQSHTTGKTRLVLHSNDKRATADVEFAGTVRARTIGHSGPATLQYVSESTFRARKPLVVGDSGVSTATAVVDAPTRLIPTNISTSLPGLRGRIGDRIARRREAGSRAQAEAIVARDTASDIRHDFNEKLDSAVAKIQSNVQAQIAALKLNGEDGGVTMRSRSTANFIEVALCPQRDSADQLQMADSTPIEGNPALAVCVHRSVATSLAANSEVRAQLMPMLSGIFANSVAAPAKTDSPKLAMTGEWLSIDLSNTSTSELPQRLAAASPATPR